MSNVRRANVKHTLDKDFQGLCDPTYQVSQHLFGDEIDKYLEDQRKSRRLANMATPRLQSSNSRRRHAWKSPAIGRRQQSFLERGYKPQSRYPMRKSFQK